jgi:hypothetical protein
MCAGTFRLSAADVNEFVDALVQGLREAPADGEAAAPPPPVVPHTGAIDVRSTAPVPDADDDDDADDADDDDGFVAWALRGGDGRASA